MCPAARDAAWRIPIDLRRETPPSHPLVLGGFHQKIYLGKQRRVLSLAAKYLAKGRGRLLLRRRGIRGNGHGYLSRVVATDFC